MSYTALYRKYRPSTFEEVVGQKHIVRTLNNALNRNRLAHAYLFSGPSGNGKTSIAKLFAKAINCTSETEVICDQCENCLNTKANTHPDIIEIDAASNNGVDEIRSLIEKVKYAPLTGKYKVYIIDEVHMLSIGAFNALLKTLEEPPGHVIFILATTEPHKVIPTIISRTQRYDFTRVSEEDIQYNIERILKNEEVAYDQDAINLISVLADGGVRESLSILEQTIAYADDKIQLEDVQRIYGVVTPQLKLELLNHILNGNMEETLSLLRNIVDQGNNLDRLIVDYINLLKESVIYSYSKSEGLLKFLTRDEVEHITTKVSAEQIIQMIDILVDLTSSRKSISDLPSFLQLATIKMINIVENSQVNTVRPEVEQRNDQTVKPEPKPEPKQVSRVHEAPEESKDEPQAEAPVSMDARKEETIIQTEDKVVAKNEKNEESSTTPPVVKPEQKSVQRSAQRIKKEIDFETYLSLLAHANKTKRIEMEAQWSSINTYLTDLTFAKYVHKLKFAKLMAVGDAYILINVENRITADDINDDLNQAGLTDLMQTIFKDKYRVFAISKLDSNQLISQFMERSKAQSLPLPITIEFVEAKKDQSVKTLEDKAAELFGEDNFIVEED
ncbi:MAG: DNA polymerase III subunit gamma/tau [Erysipelothrix sp.]|nr:DNA polymerase III subunit gamma/tau [Erysipelothrix sp.]